MEPTHPPSSEYSGWKHTFKQSFKKSGSGIGLCSLLLRGRQAVSDLLQDLDHLRDPEIPENKSAQKHEQQDRAYGQNDECFHDDALLVSGMIANG
jgi:hypothetical protein